MDKNRIEKCWLLSWEEKAPPIPSLYNCLPIDDVMESYKLYPDRIIPFYAPDPGTENILERMANYKKNGLKGCGELKVTYKWEDQKIEEYLEIINELKLPLLFHMESSRVQYVNTKDNFQARYLNKLLNGAFNGVSRYYLNKILDAVPTVKKGVDINRIFFPGYLYDFNCLEERLNQYPNLTFIGHGPHFWNNIDKSISDKYTHQKGTIKEWGIIDRLLESYDNLFCDISGKSGLNALSRDKSKSKYFLEKHKDKILYGTDNINFQYDEFIENFNLSTQAKKSIFYTNAEKIING